MKSVVERLADFDAQVTNAVLSRSEKLERVLRSAMRFGHDMDEARELYADLFHGNAEELSDCGSLTEAKKKRERLCQELVGRV